MASFEVLISLINESSIEVQSKILKELQKRQKPVKKKKKDEIDIYIENYFLRCQKDNAKKIREEYGNNNNN